MSLRSGFVKFFDSEKNFGFIKPDGSTGKDIFLHWKDMRTLYEYSPGVIDFTMEESMARKPKVGDRVVFYVADRSKGPAAFQWNYEVEWKKAQAFIATRPYPDCMLCRVILVDASTRYQHQILWEGYEPLLLEILEKEGIARFTNNPAEWYEGSVWIEEQEVDGWDRMWNPLDPGLPQSRQEISADVRQRIQRFELARLIETGVELLKEKEIKLSRRMPVVCVYDTQGTGDADEIGAALVAKFHGDARKAHDKFVTALRSCGLTDMSEDEEKEYGAAAAKLLELPEDLVDRAFRWTEEQPAENWEVFVRILRR